MRVSVFITFLVTICCIFFEIAAAQQQPFFTERQDGGVGKDEPRTALPLPDRGIVAAAHPEVQGDDGDLIDKPWFAKLGNFSDQTMLLESSRVGANAVSSAQLVERSDIKIAVLDEARRSCRERYAALVAACV